MAVTVDYGLTIPYRQFPEDETPRPYVPVRIYYSGRFIETFGLVDSGADGTLFHPFVALRLGFPLNRTATRSFVGIAGTTTGWYFDLELSVVDHQFPSQVAFS